MAVPSFSRLIESYNVKKAARQLATDLQFAKMRAVAEGVDHRVILIPGDRPRYTVERDTGGGAWTAVDITRNLGDPANPHYAKNVTMDTGANPLKVVFSPLGSASPAASVIVGSPTNQSKTVRIILTGRIRIE